MKEFFDKAAQILSEHGHCKDMLRDEQGAHCALGALNMAVTGEYRHPWRERDTVVQMVAQAVQLLIERGELTERGEPTEYSYGWLDRLAVWNNAEERTAEDVILLFKELAHD